MRLMVVALVALVAGCGGLEQIAAEDCAAWGAPPGATGHAACMAERLAALEAQELAASAALLYSMPRPTTTRCTHAAMSTSCTTW